MSSVPPSVPPVDSDSTFKSNLKKRSCPTPSLNISSTNVGALNTTIKNHDQEVSSPPPSSFPSVINSNESNALLNITSTPGVSDSILNKRRKLGDVQSPEQHRLFIQTVLDPTLLHTFSRTCSSQFRIPSVLTSNNSPSSYVNSISSTSTSRTTSSSPSTSTTSSIPSSKFSERYLRLVSLLRPPNQARFLVPVWNSDFELARQFYGSSLSPRVLDCAMIIRHELLQLRQAGNTLEEAVQQLVNRLSSASMNTTLTHSNSTNLSIPSNDHINKFVAYPLQATPGTKSTRNKIKTYSEYLYLQDTPTLELSSTHTLPQNDSSSHPLLTVNNELQNTENNSSENQQLLLEQQLLSSINTIRSTYSGFEVDSDQDSATTTAKKPLSKKRPRALLSSSLEAESDDTDTLEPPKKQFKRNETHTDTTMHEIEEEIYSELSNNNNQIIEEEEVYGEEESEDNEEEDEEEDDEDNLDLSEDFSFSSNSSSFDSTSFTPPNNNPWLL